jgi:hypothetical protein
MPTLTSLAAATAASAAVAAATRLQPSCVLDGRVALSRFGLLTATRLATEFAVWLPREVREILRDPRAYVECPEQLVPRVYCAPLRALDERADAAAMREEVLQWYELPYNEPLATFPLFHLGDREDECSIPAVAARGLRERCEQLQQGLDILRVRSGFDLPRGVILTRLEADGERSPALCDYLDAWGISTSEVARRGGSFSQPLREAIARCGVGPHEWAGAPLVAVHVVLPGFPALGMAGASLDDETIAGQWERASVFWHRV